MAMHHPLPELASFLETREEPHILLDTDYRILAANAAYRRAHQNPQDSVIGRTCFEVSHHYAVPCDQAGESCPLAQARESGQRECATHLHHTPGGEAFEMIELSPVRNRHGEVAYYIEKISPFKITRGLNNSRELVGRSPAFKSMLALVARVAPSDATVLLQGESGTGKELVAAAIHKASYRADQPFVAVDCSGLPETLFESELFGHEKGAFTGAIQRKTGLVEAASGGTLFLDEVGDIPLSMQVKLLRLLETGTYRRVGSTELRKADIRVVSATHRHISAMVEAGDFRQDLHYRINTFPIEVPPLRQRGADILLLADTLLRRVAPNRNLRLSEKAAWRLQRYHFPGNVRELRNTLERASLMCDGEIIESRHLHLDAESKPARATASISDAGVLADVERQTLVTAFAEHRGNRRSLAKKLGISERTLYRKLKAYGLSG